MRSISIFLLILVLFGLILVAYKSNSPTSITPPACKPSNTKIDKTSGYPEIQATASSGILWALPFAQDGNFHAGMNARILWKMTEGRGDIKLAAIHEDGTQVKPIRGPVSRKATTGLISLVLRQGTNWKGLLSIMSYQSRNEWKHPGQEWGSEFIFPKIGCWRILVSRWLIDTDKPITGEIAIEVKP